MCQLVLKESIACRPLRGAWISALVCLAVATLVPLTVAQNLPDGPGKATVVKLCSTCHDANKAMTLHQSREQWQATLTKMIGYGAKITPEQSATILEYLAKTFPPAPKYLVNVNSATEIELEIALHIPHKQAVAIVKYRKKHGKFKSIEDLGKVPGVDAKQIEKEKGRVDF